jgi:hypothetical protein
MQIDPDGLFLLCALCAGVGFALGWCAGFLDALRRSREVLEEPRVPRLSADQQEQSRGGEG